MKSLWITNFTNKAVSINDLGIRLQPNQSIDVFRSRHVTQTAIEKSQLDGDLKKTKLYVSSAPINIQQPQLSIFKKIIPRESVSAVKIEMKKFAELEEIMSSQGFDNLSDEEKAKLEQDLMSKKEEELIAQMLGNEEETK